MLSAHGSKTPFLTKIKKISRKVWFAPSGQIFANHSSAPDWARELFKPSKAEVPNLGYMYPQGYICLYEGVHLRLSIENKNVFAYYLFPNIYTYIS